MANNDLIKKILERTVLSVIFSEPISSQVITSLISLWWGTVGLLAYLGVISQAGVFSEITPIFPGWLIPLLLLLAGVLPVVGHFLNSPKIKTYSALYNAGFWSFLAGIIITDLTIFRYAAGTCVVLAIMSMWAYWRVRWTNL